MLHGDEQEDNIIQLSTKKTLNLNLMSEVWCLIWALRPFRGILGTLKGTDWVYSR